MSDNDQLRDFRLDHARRSGIAVDRDEDRDEFGEDGDMAKLNPPASRVTEFALDKDFQARFDEWAKEVEKDGKLEISEQKVVQQDTKILIFWRVVPRPTIAKRR